MLRASRNCFVVECRVQNGMMSQVAARALGRGLIQQWHRQVCVKMASTALIFSALQPVRPAFHLPIKQHVGPGRVLRGNHSNLLLLRQCASTDPSYGAVGSVLLETRECADGSIMYKFGSSDQKIAASTIDEQQLGESGDVEEGGLKQVVDIEQQQQQQQQPAGLEDVVVVVNGVDSPSLPGLIAETVKEEEQEGGAAIPDENICTIEQKLEDLELGEHQLDSADNPGLTPTEVPVTKSEDSPRSPQLIKEETKETKNDEGGKIASSKFFNSGAAMIPHPEKAARGGEDAYFIEGTRWIGVADGVGGWALEGINAGHYARELMWHCAELARQSEDIEPKNLLVKSFSKTKAMGSTTAVVASISGQTLNVVNMGDTGFLVVRDGIPVARSTPMQRGFNFPYQIGSVGDDPFLAEVYRVPVIEGDVVILGSDGLFDNLFEDQIVDIVDHGAQSGSGPEVIAKELAGLAHKAGADQKGLSPFAKEAQAVGYSYTGGKMDDITAVVSFVS